MYQLILMILGPHVDTNMFRLSHVVSQYLDYIIIQGISHCTKKKKKNIFLALFEKLEGQPTVAWLSARAEE